MQNPDLPMLFRQQQHQANGDQKQPKKSSKTAKKSSKQPKKHKENALNGLSESETIDKSQNSFQKKINARLLLIFVSLYSIPSNIRKKNQIKKICLQ